MWEQITILLLIIGVLAIVLELIMPGFDSFLSGIVGVLALIASAVLAVIFLEHGWIFVLANSTILGFSVFALLSFVKRRKFHNKIILSENLNHDKPAIDLSGLVGLEGKALTNLRPYGEADFDGLRIEVATNGAMVENGARVKVVQTLSNKVIVEEV